MTTLGKQIKNLRIRKKMTQEELAERLSTTKATICRYEADQRLPKFETIAEMAMILEADPDELFPLYFQPQQEIEFSGKMEAYMQALAYWVKPGLSMVAEEAEAPNMELWLFGEGSPFLSFTMEELDLAKRLIEIYISLDSHWRRELIADAEKILEFQEYRKSWQESLKKGCIEDGTY